MNEQIAEDYAGARDAVRGELTPEQSRQAEERAKALLATWPEWSKHG